MLINFCHPALKPKVSCSCLSNEEHDVTNLVSSDARERARGFLAYVVVRPPVRVELQFACHINVGRVALWPQVGSQKSTGLEIFSQHDEGGAEERLGSVELQSGEQGVVFHQAGSLGVSAPLGFVRRAFGARPAQLRRVKGLVVRIFRTRSSVPALGRVEVWGWIHDGTPPLARSSLLRRWASRDPVPGPATSCGPPSRERPPQTAAPVPEDFLDCVTCEVMALPMILPCGKAVDKSTLERHALCEAAWGRPPGDPFTGIPFTKDAHPVPAAALKARIDRFLVEHADEAEVRRAPRTVGQARGGAAPRSEEPRAGKRGAAEGGEAPGKRPRAGRPEDDDDEARLDSALKAALSGLPSFVGRAAPESPAAPGCGACAGGTELFTLPCRHLLCRACLARRSATGDLACRACGRAFARGDPCRHHT
ncbi:RING finger protein 37 [Bacillus rossius redtenbacheri]|uniref:RING finger protein 37 n=1 Tax=Bacillus rossius redtenbacheri TaxID=93214 RepID=UPI002FDDB444